MSCSNCSSSDHLIKISDERNLCQDCVKEECPPSQFTFEAQYSEEETHTFEGLQLELTIHSPTDKLIDADTGIFFICISVDDRLVQKKRFYRMFKGEQTEVFEIGTHVLDDAKKINVEVRIFDTVAYTDSKSLLSLYL